MSATASVPLRLSVDRIRLYGVGCVIMGLSPFAVLLPRWLRYGTSQGDFANYWAAGSTVGTPVLMTPGALATWQSARHLAPQPFVYPPGFAWFYVPFAHMPPTVAMIAELLCMFALCALAGWLLTEIYGFQPWFGQLVVFAWAPALLSVEIGQNTVLALVLMLAATLGLIRRNPILTGLAVGFLLYKPNEALTLVLLLAVRREWRALCIVAGCAAGWYLLSVPASNGDWAWPVRYLQIVHAWYIMDFPLNASKAFTLPGVLIESGVPALVAFGVAAAMILSALPLLARLPLLEAAAMATLVGLAANVHAWHYEAALLLPAIGYAIRYLHEPWRTRIVGATYIAVAIGMVTPQAAHLLSIVCIGGTVWWIASGYRNLRLAT